MFCCESFEPLVTTPEKTVRQQSQGVGVGQDTDENAEQIDSEEDAGANDPAVEPEPDPEGPYMNLVRSLKNEINIRLQCGHFRDAADLQRIVVYVLDNLHVGSLNENSGARPKVIQEICFRIESMAPRYEWLIPQATRLRIMANDL